MFLHPASSLAHKMGGWEGGEDGPVLVAVGGEDEAIAGIDSAGGKALDTVSEDVDDAKDACLCFMVL